MDLNKLMNDTNPEDLKKLIAILQAVVGSKDSDEQPEPQPTAIKSKGKKRQPLDGNNHNKFLDMQEKNMHKEDTAFQQKVSKHPPVPRSRPFTPISVRCRVCGNVEEVNPRLVESPDRYKCNNCSGSAG